MQHIHTQRVLTTGTNFQKQTDICPLRPQNGVRFSQIRRPDTGDVLRFDRVCRKLSIPGLRGVKFLRMVRRKSTSPPNQFLKIFVPAVRISISRATKCLYFELKNPPKEGLICG